MEADGIQQTDKLQEANRERANLEQRLNELQNAVSSEEGRSKALEKSKLKYEQTIAELDERLKREEKSRIEKEAAARRLSNELEQLRKRVAGGKTVEVDKEGNQKGQRKRQNIIK